MKVNESESSPKAENENSFLPPTILLSPPTKAHNLRLIPHLQYNTIDKKRKPRHQHPCFTTYNIITKP